MLMLIILATSLLLIAAAFRSDDETHAAVSGSHTGGEKEPSYLPRIT